MLRLSLVLFCLPLALLPPRRAVAAGGAEAAGVEVPAGDACLPPGSVVSPEAVARFHAAAERTRTSRARGGGADAAPDKLEDQWTISHAFRRDLAEQLTGFAENLTALEVGSYFGYTTRLLSDRFAQVIALDAMPQFLAANRYYNEDRLNILYLKFDTIVDNWGLFAANAIHVVLLDASHDFETVYSDVTNCLKLPTVSLIIFDDYGAEPGVRQAVHAFVAAGRLRPLLALGEGADGRPWSLRDGREVAAAEAVACEVLRGPAEVPGATPAAPERVPGAGARREAWAPRAANFSAWPAGGQ